VTRTRALVTVLVIVLLTAAGTVWMLVQGGVIGAHVPRAVDVALVQLVVVPPTDGGCPGEQFHAPSVSARAPTFGSDGSRSDATVMLGAGNQFLVVCLGPVSERSDAPARASAVSQNPAVADVIEPPRSVHNALGATTTYTTKVGTSLRLTEWQVDKDGWAYVVGGLHRDGTPDIAAVVDQIIATWEWLPATPATPAT
jgi:hypothetical protein